MRGVMRDPVWRYERLEHNVVAFWNMRCKTLGPRIKQGCVWTSLWSLRCLQLSLRAFCGNNNQNKPCFLISCCAWPITKYRFSRRRRDYKQVVDFLWDRQTRNRTCADLREDCWKWADNNVKNCCCLVSIKKADLQLLVTRLLFETSAT